MTNGSFETGDFTGWTQVGNTGFTGVTGNFGGINPEDGSYQAYFGPIGSLGGISQDLATVAGQDYDISFSLSNFGGTPSEYSVQFGSTVLTDVINPLPFGYTELTFVGTATAAITGLTLSFQQNPSYFLLDNVVVTSAVPEPSTLISGSMAVLIGLGCAWRRRKSKATI